MTSGYYQIAIDEQHIQKTAFAFQNGLYEYTRMSFGLTNGPSTFQRAIDQVLRKELGVFVLPYLDDLIIFSKNMEDHIQHLNIVLGKIKASGFTLNKKKCKFGLGEIMILGNIVSEKSVKPDPAKIEALKNYQKPINIKELRAFLGLSNYIRLL